MDTAKVVDARPLPPGAGHGVRQPAGGRRAQAARARSSPTSRSPRRPGSGSEATTVAVLDLPELKVKSGISHRYLRPTQAVVDPELTRTLAGEVVASAGLDVICHAAESFLSKPYTSRPRPASPGERPPYQGSNPVADLWSARALENGGRFLRRAVADPDDVEARGAMMLSATLAGIGFGSAGVHIPHACAYPIAGLKHEYRPAGYPRRPRLRPPRPVGDRHLAGGVPLHLRGRAGAPRARRRAARRRRRRGPTRCRTRCGRSCATSARRRASRAFGYSEDDIPELVEGARKQARLLAIAPREPSDDDLAAILRASL